MPSTKKRAHSPEDDRHPSKRRCPPVQAHQNPPLKRTRWRGPKDDRIKALRKLERKRHSKICHYTANTPIIAPAHQPSTLVHHTTPATGETPFQGSPGLEVPHSPPSLPEVDYSGLEDLNNSPASPRVPSGSDLCMAPSVRNNSALLRQTKHLDDHTPAWNQRRNNQATQWRSVAIPQLIPIYLANRATTESGKLPSPLMPNHLCQCNKLALKVKMVTWDRKSSPHLVKLSANCILQQDHRQRC